MARMIAIGPEQFTLPFSAIGFETAEADAASFLGKLREVLADGAVGLVVCGESAVTEERMLDFKELCSGAKAAVLMVPDGPKSGGIGLELVRSAIERAAGADLLGSVVSDQSSDRSDRSD